MRASLVALAVISAIVAVGSSIGFYAGSHRKMDLEQWIVGGRGFGMLLVWRFALASLRVGLRQRTARAERS